jgi:GT2 family glycosyltransferase
MSGPRAAVIVPNWNSALPLERCLLALEGEGTSIELLVVDNGSTDSSLELLSRLGVPCHALPENRGFGRAVACGLERTSAPFVFVLNVDTFVEPGCIESLASELDGDPALGGVQPKILRAGSSPPLLYSAGQRLLSDGRALEEGAGAPAGAPYESSREIFGVSGAACLLRRELLERLGGYDERYFAFYEDVDLNARAQLLGWSFRYVPTAVVWHVGAATWRAAPGAARFNARLVARNRLATALKVLPARHAFKVGYAELGSLARSARRGTFSATLGGKVAALAWLPELLRERRDLSRRGSSQRLARWFDQESRWTTSWARTPVEPTVSRLGTSREAGRGTFQAFAGRCRRAPR